MCAYFRNKPIAPFCDEIDTKKKTCALDSTAVMQCNIIKRGEKVPLEYQVGDSNSDGRKKAVVYVFVLSHLCHLCIGPYVAVFCDMIMKLIWGNRINLRVAELV